MASAPETFIRNVVNKSIEKVVAFNRNRMPQPAKPHPFLTGVHEPMDTELTLNELAVEGSIPHELNGRYLRIGPNPIEPPDAASYHWFLGDGMVHGLCLKGGRPLWYKNRWIRSHAVTAALGEPLPLSPGSPADIVAVDRDPVASDPDQLRGTVVFETWVQGERVVVDRTRPICSG